jgi:hypothetical protein
MPENTRSDLKMRSAVLYSMGTAEKVDSQEAAVHDCPAEHKRAVRK